MLIASLLTGRYVFDIDNLSFEQIAFSTVPGVWEEVYFRGIIMMVLLFALKDLRRAMVVQCVIFGLLSRSSSASSIDGRSFFGAFMARPPRYRV